METIIQNPADNNPELKLLPYMARKKIMSAPRETLSLPAANRIIKECPGST
jgi:hypothetical protein